MAVAGAGRPPQARQLIGLIGLIVRARISPVWWGVGGGLLSAPLWLIAAGTLQWTSADLGAPFFIWYGQRSPITPALAVRLPHIWLFAPWWTLLSAGALGVLVGLDLWLSTRLLHAGRMDCRQRRVGLLALLPASLAGPVCCGAPLVALLGVPALVSLAVAPYATGLSLVLLSAHLLYLRSRWRAGQVC